MENLHVDVVRDSEIISVGDIFVFLPKNMDYSYWIPDVPYRVIGLDKKTGYVILKGITRYTYKFIEILRGTSECTKERVIKISAKWLVNSYAFKHFDDMQPYVEEYFKIWLELPDKVREIDKKFTHYKRFKISLDLNKYSDFRKKYPLKSDSYRVSMDYYSVNDISEKELVEFGKYDIDYFWYRVWKAGKLDERFFLLGHDFDKMKEYYDNQREYMKTEKKYDK